MQKHETPEMFTEIARTYDLLNHVLSLNVDRLWRRDLIRLAEAPDDGCVLDACTGTADVAIGFASRLRSGRVFGVDLSAGMLGAGHDKLARRNLNGRVRLVESDVLALPFRDGSFDAVTIAFGLRNLPDYRKGVAEMARVLRPGGKLAILEFCPPAGGLPLRAYNFYLRRVLPFIGGLVSGSSGAYRYLASSIGDFLSCEEVHELVRSAGLKGFQAKRMTGGIAYIYRGEKA
ncbi:MAG: bifunctional demethylmenaquinone methyltransferase/2-methoxy-6-polyprenyl-1,4-benzoquinol methylase UbiE [Candidatus Krumholzibacteriia bacterium]